MASMFTALLDKRGDEVEKPPLLPIGRYVVQIKTHPEMKEENELWHFIEFPLSVVTALDDVDPQELEDYGQVAGAYLRRTFVFSTDDEGQQARTEYQLTQFLIMIGAMTEEQTIKEGLAQSVGLQFIAEVFHKPRKDDPDEVNVEIKRTYALE